MERPHFTFVNHPEGAFLFHFSQRPLRYSLLTVSFSTFYYFYHNVRQVIQYAVLTALCVPRKLLLSFIIINRYLAHR